MSIQSSIRTKLLQEERLIFILSFIILFNLGFHILVYFPLPQSPDMQNYLAMAHLNFNQSLVRRYRVIIPLFAYFINLLFGRCFNLFHPWSFDGDFSLCFSFLLVNTAIMSYVMMMIFKLCRSFQIEFWFCAISVIAVLSSRWTAELSGLPLVDSLYLLALVFALYGIKTNQWSYLIASIWLGPWAKEAYIFMVPVILIFAKAERWRMMTHLLLSGILVFGFRLMLDHFYGQDVFNSLRDDADSFNSIQISLNRLFSFHGLYDLFSVIGFWLVFPLIALLKYRSSLALLHRNQFLLFGCYLLIVLFQALLSTDISRMFYLSIPVIAVWIGISLKILHTKWIVKIE